LINKFNLLIKLQSKRSGMCCENLQKGKPHYVKLYKINYQFA